MCSEVLGGIGVNFPVKNNKSIKDLVDLGGKSGDIRLFRAGAKKFTSDEKELLLLERYFVLIVYTDYLRPEVKEFFVNRKSYKQIYEMFPDMGDGYLRTLIYNERNRLFGDLVVDPLYEVKIKNLAVEEVKALTDRIDELIKKQTIIDSVNPLDYLYIDLKEFADIDREFNRYVKDQDFIQSAKKLQSISKPYMEMVLNAIDKKLLGYFVYLLTTKDDSLTDKDKIKKRQLREVWWLPNENN